MLPICLSIGYWWEQRESNPRPSACKADALNQLSYAPDYWKLPVDKRDDSVKELLWEQRESNPRPSACKADALNQLSYAPFLLRTAKVGTFSEIANIFLIFCDLLKNGKLQCLSHDITASP